MTSDRIMNFISGIEKPWVMVLIGPPLSGKDFFLKELDLENVIIISRDKILLDMADSSNYDEAFKNVNQRAVDSQLQTELREASLTGENVVINMTNMTSKRRRQNLTNFQNHIKIAVIFPILSTEEYERRDWKRKEEEGKSIPTSVLRSMISSYQPISELEGFDKVISL